MSGQNTPQNLWQRSPQSVVAIAAAIIAAIALVVSIFSALAARQSAAAATRSAVASEANVGIAQKQLQRQIEHDSVRVEVKPYKTVSQLTFMPLSGNASVQLPVVNLEIFNKGPDLAIAAVTLTPDEPSSNAWGSMVSFQDTPPLHLLYFPKTTTKHYKVSFPETPAIRRNDGKFMWLPILAHATRFTLKVETTAGESFTFPVTIGEDVFTESVKKLLADYKTTFDVQTR